MPISIALLQDREGCSFEQRSVGIRAHRPLRQNSPGVSLKGAGLVMLMYLLQAAIMPQQALARGMSLPCSGPASPLMPTALHASPGIPPRLIVIGFMGGSIRADDPVHRESQLARHLQQAYPTAVHTAVFANRNGHLALQTVLGLLGETHGCLTPQQKQAARIVIYGHSWGASQAVTLARLLNQRNIPVLLTVQVDSVRKLRQEDSRIPPNVREAVNFYQTQGWLRGRMRITAVDPSRTDILGNFESSYRGRSVSCAGFPWYARAFMRPHIQIENDPEVWNRIEALIAAKIPEKPVTTLSAAD